VKKKDLPDDLTTSETAPVSRWRIPGTEIPHQHWQSQTSDCKWPQITIFSEFAKIEKENLLKFHYNFILSFHERSERAKRANVVSGMVENLCRKKFSPARIGVGGCRLSVRPSVRLSTLLCWITFEPVELSWWNFGSLPNSSQVIFWHYFGNPRTLGLGPRASGGSNFQTYLLPGFW
jgi:hypothetical protein